jgi:hypothetical protein
MLAKLAGYSKYIFWLKCMCWRTIMHKLSGNISWLGRQCWEIMLAAYAVSAGYAGLLC